MQGDEAQAGADRVDPVRIHLHAPTARFVEVAVDGETERRRLRPLGRGAWIGEVPLGATYVALLDGQRPVLDPHATLVEFPAGHRRAANKPGGGVQVADFPRAVALPWPARRPQRWSSRPIVVYEAHVRGQTCTRPTAAAGTFRAMIDELPRSAGLGVSVLELLPVHQFDPDEGNYWGYMPMVFGAIHRHYTIGPDPAAELAELVEAAHAADIEVWLDVVVNHTTESDHDGPTYTLRALDDRGYYVTNDDGEYIDDTGTGNMVDAWSSPSRHLIMEALDRLADLGVDGLRFDLAAVLARDEAFVRAIGDWAERRGVRLIAEPWDLARYLLGAEFPDPRWMQWNGRFRDDVRSFLRAEPDAVAGLAERVAGSRDLFNSPASSVNFLTAHDGFTLYDLFAYDHPHNDANGWGGTDGHHDNRSWNCGWEGDVDVPAEVMALRRRQQRNAFCLLLLSAGVPMWVAGDEVGRTQGGNNNAYNQDNATSWLDWQRAAGFADLEAFVARLTALRASVPALAEPTSSDGPTMFGPRGAPDFGVESRSLAWLVGDLYVMANAWWEPLEFAVQADGEWHIIIDTSDEAGFVEPRRVDGPVTAGPRSVLVARRN